MSHSLVRTIGAAAVLVGMQSVGLPVTGASDAGALETVPPPSEFVCQVTFTLQDDLLVGSVQWETDSTSSSGRFVGSGADVECAGTAEEPLLAFFHDQQARVLSSGLASEVGVQGPTAIATCDFRAQTVPEDSDFAVTVTEATDVELEPLLPLPSVVASVECPCGDGDIDGEEECDDGNNVDLDGCTSQCKIEATCGDPTEDAAITASDALRTLQRAVGMNVFCPLWSCDTDSSGAVTASDAARVLRVSVGLGKLDCPPRT